MTIETLRQLGSHTATRWLAGALAVCVVMAVGASAAWAGSNCEAESNARGDHAEEFSGSFSPADLADALPCDFDAPGYNACFVANPVPSSSLPGWLTEMQARDAAEQLVAGIGNSGDGASNTGTRASHPPEWLEEIVRNLRRFDGATQPGNGCFEGQYDVECGEIPSPEAVVTANAAPPVDRTDNRIELPWEPDDDQWAQSPLVVLRVGPAPEHSSPPDRPPPA